MNAVENPFSPGAGSPPPELVGRENILAQARILLGRIKEKRPEKSILLNGLRGVGKTVLLNEIERIAKNSGYETIALEAHEGKGLAMLMAPALKKLLFELDRLASAGHKAKQALAVLKNFASGLKLKVGEIEIGLSAEAAKGTADSGDLENDLPNLLVSVAEAAEERKMPVAILVDELQYFVPRELSALIMGMHKMQQRQLPLVLLGAGLPILPGLAGESKSYAERLFNFPAVGALSQEDAWKALRDPTRLRDVDFKDDALAEIFRYTQGYPYFLQEWGYQVWNHASASPITLEIVQSTTPFVIESLDANFFRVRFNRLTPSEKRFLRSMASLGAGPVRSSDVGERLGFAANRIAPLRSQLIKKGMIYSPAYGELAFTVPLFDQFLIRSMPDEQPSAGQ
jgi:hypothetical protein